MKSPWVGPGTRPSRRRPTRPGNRPITSALSPVKLDEVLTISQLSAAPLYRVVLCNAHVGSTANCIRGKTSASLGEPERRPPAPSGTGAPHAGSRDFTARGCLCPHTSSLCVTARPLALQPRRPQTRSARVFLVNPDATLGTTTVSFLQSRSSRRTRPNRTSAAPPQTQGDGRVVSPRNEETSA